MGLRCFFNGHKYPEYPDCQRIHARSNDDDDIYCYRCECSVCGKIEYFVTTLVPFQLPWNKGNFEPEIFRPATENEVFKFDCNPHDRLRTGLFKP